MFMKLSNRDAFGHPLKFRSAKEAGINKLAIVSGYSLWMNADEITGDDGDAIEIAGHFSQSTVGYRPTLKKAANGINGHNALLFGSDDWMTSGANVVALNGKITAFCVFNPNFTGDKTLFNQQAATGSLFNLYRKSGDYYIDWTVAESATVATPNGTAYMLEYRITDTNNIVRINDTDSASGSQSLGATSVPIFLAKAQSFGGLGNFEGLITEFIFYERELNADELTKIRNYLNNKYSLW